MNMNMLNQIDALNKTLIDIIEVTDDFSIIWCNDIDDVDLIDITGFIIGDIQRIKDGISDISDLKTDIKMAVAITDKINASWDIDERITNIVAQMNKIVG